MSQYTQDMSAWAGRLAEAYKNQNLIFASPNIAVGTINIMIFSQKDLPFLSLCSISAPFDSKSVTSSEWPPAQANVRAVSWLLSVCASRSMGAYSGEILSGEAGEGLGVRGVEGGDLGVTVSMPSIPGSWLFICCMFNKFFVFRCVGFWGFTGGFICCN